MVSRVTDIAVDSSIRTCAPSSAAPAAPGEQGSEAQPVERVAGAEQHRGQGARDRRAAGGDHADERELAGAGEDQERQRAGLRDRQPGGDRDRAEAHAVRPGGDADAEAVADDRRPLARVERGVGHPERLVAAHPDRTRLVVEVVEQHVVEQQAGERPQPMPAAIRAGPR